MTIWQWLFYLGVYSAALACLYAIYRIYLDLGGPAASRQLLIFVGFGGLFWLLESWAHLRTPFYYYPTPFPIHLPVFDWNSVPWFPGAFDSPCEYPPPPPTDMPLAIPLLQAAMTFAVMWTATLLKARAWLQPFLGGLVFLAIDAFLDPVLATTFNCIDGPQTHAGLGLWQWHVYDISQVDSTVYKDLGSGWFGVPLFNYAAWYAAPVVLIALVKLIDWILPWMSIGGTPTITAFEAVFLVIIFIGFLIIFGMAPSAPWPPWLQGAMLVLFIVGTLIAVLWFVGQYDHTNHYRWWFIHPLLVCVAVPLLVFLGTGLIITLPYLWIVGLVTIPLVLFFAISPYLNAP